MDQETFDRLAETYQRDTMHFSSTRKCLEHPAFQTIIDGGHAVIPMILNAYTKRATGSWALALCHITGESTKIAEKDYGKMEVVRDYWMKWGRERGYIK